MVICKGVIEGDVLKIPFNVCVKKLLNHFEVKVGVNEYGPNICFDYVGKTLGGTRS